MRTFAVSLFFLTSVGTVAAQTPDWVALLQKPFENRGIPDPKLPPLLQKADGQPVRTVEEWQVIHAGLRDAWLARLGAPPEKPAALDMLLESTEMLEGYERRLIRIRTEGDDLLRAYVLIPKGLKPGERVPAVVVFHPTTRDTLLEPVGLGSRKEMALAVHLTRRGYITLSPECYILKDPKGWAKGQADALAKRRPRWTGMGKMTFDASRCFDFLETLPNVDPTRIACIGHSLGAKEVLYAMAFEPRYRAGVFCEGGIGLRMSNWTDPWYLTSAMVPFIPKLEHHQLLGLIAPRPFLIIGGDSADGDASWPFVAAARPVYRLHDAGDRIGLWNHRQKHSFPKESQELAYRWLDHWLMPKSNAPRR